MSDLDGVSVETAVSVSELVSSAAFGLQAARNLGTALANLRQIAIAAKYTLEIIERIVAIIGSNYGVIPRLVAQTAQAKRIDDLTVYEAVLRRADFLMNVTPETHLEARQALEQAVQTAPTYAPAWAALGGMYTSAYILGFDAPDDPLGEALTCANRAIRLDSFCQEAHSVLANVYFQRRDQAGVRRVCLRSFDLNPYDAANIGIAGFWLALAGDEESGLTLLGKAIKLNPFYAV